MAVTLVCTADTYLMQDEPSLNFGSDTLLDYANVTLYSWYRESLVKFSTLSAGTYSKIYLYLCRAGGDTDTDPAWRRMNTAWAEMTATWNNTIRNYTNITVPRIRRDGDWITYDITDQYAYIAAANQGFALVPPYTNSRGFFRSKEAGADYAPFIVAYTASDLLPPYNLVPTVARDGNVTFTWAVDFTAAGYEIQYKQNLGDAWTTITTNTRDSSNLNTGTVYWRVRARNASNVWSPWSVMVSFPFVRVVLGAPTNLQPTTNQTGNVTVSWTNVQGAVSSTQAAYEVQWGYDQINWTTISGTGSTAQHVIPQGTFVFEEDSRTIYYRVRVRNNFNAWSDWSSSSTFLYYSSNPKKPTGLQLVQNQGILNVSWNYVPYNTESQSGADVQYSFDNQNWNNLAHSGSTTAYSIAENLLNLTTVTHRTVYVRVRTKNSLGGTSPWSDTAQISYKTTKPIAPTNLQPFGQQIQGTIVASWTFTSTGRGDTQQAFELQYKCEGQDWITVTGTTASQYTFQNLVAGTVLWKVRAQSTTGIWSDYSVEASFIYAVKPNTPSITSPTTFDISKPMVTWSSQGQTSFRIQVLKGLETYFDTQEITSSAMAYTLEKALENESTYTLRLQIKNRFALWSDWTTQTISTAFAEPNQPSISLFVDYIRASIHIRVTNPVPEEVTGNEILRRRFDETEFKAIAEIDVNGTFTDYTPTSEVQYEYRARALTEDGGYKDSEIQNTAVKVRNTQLANTQNYSEWVELIYDPAKSYVHTFAKKLVTYAGRRKPVVLTRPEEAWRMTVSFSILDESVLYKLLGLVQSQEILLFRDSRGQNKYVFATQEPQVKQNTVLQYWEINFEITEVDFND